MISKAHFSLGSLERFVVEPQMQTIHFSSLSIPQVAAVRAHQKFLILILK